MKSKLAQRPGLYARAVVMENPMLNRSTHSDPPVCKNRCAHSGLRVLLIALCLLSRSAISQPLNDNFADRILFSGPDTNILTDNSLATIEPNEPMHPPPASGHTLWWTWTAPGDGWVQFSRNDLSAPAGIAVYMGDALTNLVLAQQILERWFDFSQGVIQTNPHAQWVVRAGHAYHIVASAVTNDTGIVTGEVNFNVSFVQGPPNDYFPGTLVTNLPFSAFVGNWGASPEPGEPLLVDTGLGASIWWSWQAPERGRLSIHAVNYYPTFGVFTGDEINRLTQVGGGDGTVSVAVQASQVYRLGVDTWPDDGVFIGFSVDFSPSPTNDDFTTRIPISGGQVCVDGNNRGATPEPEEEIFLAAAGGTVWYSWLAPADGWVRVKASSTNGRPVFIVYEGPALTNLTNVIASSFPTIPNPLNHIPGSASTAFAAHAGVEYQIAVDTWPIYGNEPNFTDFELCVDETTLRIISPTNGESFAATTLPVFTVNTPLESVDGVLKFVDYQQGRIYSGRWGYSLGTSTNPPFTVTAHYMYPGRWSVMAHATNALGQQRASQPVWFKVRPGNDDFTNASVLTGDRWGFDWFGLSVYGTTLFATAEVGEPAHGGKPEIATVWYSWTAPASGIAQFYYELNDPGTVMSVYSGDSVTGLQSVPLTHPFGFPFDVFGTVGGTTYRFAISAEASDLEEYSAGFSMGLELVASQPPTMSVLRSNTVPAVPCVVVSGTPGQRFVIEASTNLSHWSPVFTNTLFTTTFEFSDSAAENYSSRFYRAVVE